MRARTCCCLIIPVVLFGACLTSFVLYYWASGGGYWENRPMFDRISGPMRFMQYVCAPIPLNIYGVRGGYSGITDGFVGTSFNLRGDFPVDRCLGNAWAETPVDDLSGILWIELSPDAVTRAFVYGSEEEQNLRFLLLDEDVGRGYLFVP